MLTASRPWATTTGMGKWLSAGNGTRDRANASLGRARRAAAIARRTMIHRPSMVKPSSATATRAASAIQASMSRSTIR